MKIKKLHLYSIIVNIKNKTSKFFINSGFQMVYKVASETIDDAIQIAEISAFKMFDNHEISTIRAEIIEDEILTEDLS